MENICCWIGPVISQNPSIHSFRSTYDIGDKPMVKFFGQKYAYKGISSLVDAASIVWNNIPETIFVFIGPRTKYSILIFSKFQGDRIIEIGNVDLNENSSALAACDILCLPSTQESFGGVYTEAWVYKKPVIGCKIPVVSDVIDSGKNGYTVSQDPSQIAEKINLLLLNPNIASEMGNSGFEKTNSIYSWDLRSSRTEEAYFTDSKIIE